MHELSVAESILDIVEGAVEGKPQLASATLTLGPFAGVCADSLKFWFPEVAEERGFGRPELHVNEVPARVQCHACGVEYATHNVMEGCPDCGSLDRSILSGREFTLESIELRDDEHE